MANAISLTSSPPQMRSLRSLWTLRMALGLAILLSAAVSLFGTVWDIQWHTFIGRDRVLIPPHLMILSGVVFSGLLALASVLIETVWARRSTHIATISTHFAETFYGPLGGYVAGFAALDAGIAFPLDQYWHALYGIDVTIWAPFHIMLLMGIGLTALGATYMLLSAAQLASNAGVRGVTRTGYLAAIVAFATMLSIMTLFLFEALGVQGLIVLGNIRFSLFPMLSGLLIAWLLVAAVTVIPWRSVASLLILVYVFLAILFSAFVPPAMNWLVTSEQLSYRKNLGMAANFSIITLRWPLAIIVGAILIDVCVRLAKRKQWSGNRLLATLTLAASVGSIPVVVVNPGVSIQLVQRMGILGLLLSLFLGVLGAYTGIWFGRRMGGSMQLQERNV